MSAAENPSGGASKRLARRRVLRGMAGILLTPLLTACPSRADKLATVMMTGQNAFAPASLVIGTDTRVIWKNEDTAPHTITCDPAKSATGGDVVLPTGATPWDSGLLFTGDTWARVFDVPGTYVYFSTPDAGSGMIGTITVQG